MSRKPKLIPKVKSLSELFNLAQTDEKYATLLKISSNNLGGPPEPLLNEAYKYLCTTAGETSEAGVIKEVNYCRDLVDPAPKTKSEKMMDAISESLRLKPNSIEFNPDWKQLWDVEKAEYELHEFKFAGAGWYLTDTDAILVLPSFEKEKFWFLVYNGRNPCDIFNAIVNAPVRQDDRGTSRPKRKGLVVARGKK